MSHTPGPWFVEFSSTLGNRIVHGEMTKSGFRDDVPMDPGDAEAVDNLTLAAASPQMLEALKVCLALFGDTAAEQDSYAAQCVTSGDTKFIRKARAAIAAAEGGAK
jgi:hypothetical protein